MSTKEYDATLHKERASLLHTPYSSSDLVSQEIKVEKTDNSKMTKMVKDSIRHPVYRGVRMRKLGKWVSEIRESRKKSRIWLAMFPTPEMAARAHDVAALSIKGSSTILKLPKLVESFPRPVSLSPQDIQIAALKAAHMEPMTSFASLSSCSSSSSSSLESLVLVMDLSRTEAEELREIMELPCDNPSRGPHCPIDLRLATLQRTDPNPSIMTLQEIWTFLARVLSYDRCMIANS